jgi:N-methylhydantoinase B
MKKDGTSQRYAFGSGIRVDKDDVIRIITGAGGGLGNPKERDRAAVADDIRNGFISAERAREVYGAEEL